MDTGHDQRWANAGMADDSHRSSLPPRTAAEIEATEATSPLARRVVRPAQEFIHQEGAAGRLLIVAALVGLVLANSPLAEGYHALWETEVGLRIGSSMSSTHYSNG